MTQKQEFPVMRIRNILIVEKSNQGINLTMINGTWSVVPVVGDAFQVLKNDEYVEYHVTHRIFREVHESEITEKHPPVALFDAVVVVIRRPMQWHLEQ